MINASAEALVELINEDDLARRATFPEIKDIRAIAAHLAMRVMLQALDEGIKVKTLNYLYSDWKHCTQKITRKELQYHMWSLVNQI